MTELIIDIQLDELSNVELNSTDGGIIIGGPALNRGVDMLGSFVMGFACGFLSL